METTFPPTFIGGFRSGSTLLINLLGLQPEIAPWFETKFICEALRWQRVREHPNQAEQERQLMQPVQPSGYTLQEVVERMRADMHTTAARIDGRLKSGKAAHERFPIGADSARYPLHEADTALERWRADIAADTAGIPLATGRLITALGEHHAQAWERPVWVNKTPEIPRFGQELRSCLGSCRIILLIRDGRQVALSYKRFNGDGSVEQIASWWKGLIHQSRAANTEPDTYLEIRYEDLISEPVHTINRVLSFLGLPAAGDGIVAEYRRHMGTNAFRRPFWLQWQRLRSEERRIFDRVAGDLREELGYRD